MISASVLAYSDYEEPFILYIDVSYEGLRFIFTQIRSNRKEHLIQYGGKKLKPAKRNYTIINLEYFSIV